jgi:hypothetical protein
MRFLLRVLVTLIVLPLLPFLLVLVLIFRARDKLTDRRFRREHDQQVYFVGNRRHDWHEFVINNVLPAITPPMSLVWTERASGSVRDQVLPESLWALLQGRKKPLLVLVTRNKYRIVPLHERLLEWKEHSRRSEFVQSQVRLILEAAQEELKTP